MEITCKFDSILNVLKCTFYERKDWIISSLIFLHWWHNIVGVAIFLACETHVPLWSLINK